MATCEAYGDDTLGTPNSNMVDLNDPKIDEVHKSILHIIENLEQLLNAVNGHTNKIHIEIELKDANS